MNTQSAVRGCSELGFAQPNAPDLLLEFRVFALPSSQVQELNDLLRDLSVETIRSRARSRTPNADEEEIDYHVSRMINLRELCRSVEAARSGFIIIAS
jgi:hypothetical protein